MKHLKEVDADKVDWKAKTADYWKDNLTKLQYKVCRKSGTERAFTGKYNDYKGEGDYFCSNCGQKLFSSDTKFKSGSGWPSYTAPASESAVTLHQDNTLWMKRVEVKCSRCDAHLGHVFDDGPEPTGKRYCINSVCLLHSDHYIK